MLRLAVRELSRRRLRAFLLALTVIIAGSFLVAVLILGESLLAGLETNSTDSAEMMEVSQFSIQFIRDLLLAFIFLAFVTGALVISITFWVILSQRTYELALLRIIGISKGQIFGLVLWEALIIGLSGGILAIAFGTALAQGFFFLSDALNWEVLHVGLRFNIWIFLAPILLSVVVMVLAALLPAFLASRKPPLRALTEVYGVVKNKHKWFLLIGLILMLLGALFNLLIWLTPYTPLEAEESSTLILVLRVVALWGGQTLVFIGTAFLSTPITKWTAGLFRRLLKNSRFISWRLAMNNIWRQPMRTALVADILMIGITLITIITISVSSIRATFIHVIDQTRPSDWTLFTVDENFADEEFAEDFPSSFFADLDEAQITPQMFNELAELEATGEISGIHFTYITVAKDTPEADPGSGADPDVIDERGPYPNPDFAGRLAGIDAQSLNELFDLGLSAQDLAALEADQILIADSTTIGRGQPTPAIGDSITLLYLDGSVGSAASSPSFMEVEVEDPARDNDSEFIERTFVIGGFFEPFESGSAPSPTFLVNSRTFRSFTGIDNYTVVEFNNAPGFDHQKTQESLEVFLKDYDNLAAGGKLEIIEFINTISAWIINIFRGLLALAIVVAIVGILNVLILAVAERTREIGLLRALGVAARVVRRTLIVEAFLIASIGVFLGVFLAIVFTWGNFEVWINQPLAAEAAQSNVEDEEELELLRVVFHVPWKEILSYYAAAIALALLASLAPAIRATRIKVIEALRSN